MLLAFCRGRALTFHSAPVVSACLVRPGPRLSTRFACALVGFSLLRGVWFGRNELCAHRRRAARFQLSDRAGGLWNQSGEKNQSPLAHRLGDCMDGWNRWPLSLLLVGPAFWSSDCLHIRRAANTHLVCRALASPRETVVAGVSQSGSGPDSVMFSCRSW